MILDVDVLISGCREDSSDAGLIIESHLIPLAGKGAPVKPAVYEGGTYQLDKRWTGSGDSSRRVEVVVVDNVPSQANRLEAALRRNRAMLGLPEMVLDLSGVGQLPPHLPTSISSYSLPHRNGDAYLRDSMLGGVKFVDTEIGRSLLRATADDPASLLQWMPQSLLYGFWQSHLGKKGSQAKLARSWVSEIAGFDPATVETKTKGVKGDPLALSIDDAIEYDDNNLLSWSVVDEKKAGKSKAKDSLAEIGHGQVLASGSPAGVSFAWIEQRATLSLAGLRRVVCTPAERGVLVALGIVAHVHAFGRSMSLRSGCDLNVEESTWTWITETERIDVAPMSRQAANELLHAAVQRASAEGSPVSEWASSVVTLEPVPSLAKVIQKSYPTFEGA